MKKNEKRMILIIILVGVVIITMLSLLKKSNQNVDSGEIAEGGEVVEKYVDVLEDGTKLNNSDKLSETKIVDGLEVTGIQLTHQNGISKVIATVVNNTAQDKGLTSITLTLVDENNNVLEQVDGLISPVKAGESVQLNVGVSADYANAYDFRIEKK